MTDTTIGRKPAMILFYIFLIAPFFQLELLLNLIPVMGKAYTLWQLLAGAAFFAVWYKGGGKIRDFSWIHLLFAALLLIMTVASAINPDASLKRAVQYSYGSLAVGLIAEYGVKKDRENFLTGMEIFFGALVALNIVTILLFPGGMYVYDRALEENWLLGYKNYHVVYIMALLIFGAVHSLLQYGKIAIRVWIYIAMSLLSSALVAARTPMMAILLFAASIMFTRLRNFTPFFNSLTYLAAYVVAFVMIVVVRIENLPVLGKLVGREITFNNRTYFWDKAMTEFWEYPVLGHGYQQFVMFRGYVTTHNQIVEILYKTGVAGLIVFAAILAVTAYRLFVNREGIVTKYLAVFFASYLVLFLMEQYAFANYFFLFVLAFMTAELDGIAQNLNGELSPVQIPRSNLKGWNG